MVKKFIIASVIYLVLDGIWLGLIAKSFYFKSLGPIARRVGDSLKPDVLASVLAYIVLVLGVLIFVLPKTNGQIIPALLYGALMGLIVYGVYDFTNMATLNIWSWKLVVIDLLWGTIAYAIVSAGTNLFSKII